MIHYMTDAEDKPRTFATWLQLHQTQAGLKAAEIARRTGLSRTMITYALRGTGKTGNPTGHTRETVINLAEAVEGDIDEALTLAGYAPLRPPPTRRTTKTSPRLEPGTSSADNVPGDPEAEPERTPRSYAERTWKSLSATQRHMLRQLGQGLLDQHLNINTKRALEHRDLIDNSGNLTEAGAAVLDWAQNNADTEDDPVDEPSADDLRSAAPLATEASVISTEGDPANNDDRPLAELLVLLRELSAVPADQIAETVALLKWALGLTPEQRRHLMGFLAPLSGAGVVHREWVVDTPHDGDPTEVEPNNNEGATR